MSNVAQLASSWTLLPWVAMEEQMVGATSATVRFGPEGLG